MTSLFHIFYQQYLLKFFFYFYINVRTIPWRKNNSARDYLSKNTVAFSTVRILREYKLANGRTLS